MKKTLCLVLSLMMICTVLVSCVQSTENPDETTASTAEQTTGTTSSGAPHVLFDPTNMKARHEWEEKVMYVLCWNSEHKEFEVTEEQITVDELNAAIFERDNQVKAKLGLTAIDYNEQIGTSGNEENYAKYVERVALNHDAEVDVIATYSRSAGLCAAKGYYMPINYYDKYVNLSNPWYPQALIDEIAIRNQVYLVSGDISTNLLFLTYGIIFNKELLTTLKIDYNELYQLAEEGKWTLEEFYKLTEYYDDADGDGKKSLLDGYGIRTGNYHLDAIYTGSGLKIIDVNNNAEKPEDLIKISSDYGSSKAIDLSDKIGALFQSDYGYGETTSISGHFAQTRNTIALLTRIRDIGRDIMKIEKKLEVGVLPIPKYDEQQEDYKCISGNPLTLWGVYSGNMDLEREESAAGFIEYMGYYAMENTTEAVFANTFLARYADQPDDANMFNIIRRTTAFDVGRIFSIAITGIPIIDQWSNTTCNGAKWAAVYAQFAYSYNINAKKASLDFWNLTEKLKNPYEHPYE